MPDLPSRRQILAYLSEASMTAGEIAERFDMSRPALSKHLKVLEHSGLVVYKKGAVRSLQHLYGRD